MRLTGQETSTYRILKRFNFTSERRMSSVLVRTPEGRIFAYVKGSDDAITAILKRDFARDVADAQILADINNFASKGLRTLVFAFKELDNVNANNSGQGWDNIACEYVESDLTLLGVTGVEDVLQNNVERCISDFRDAGMQVWMLTGDKGLTAKQIGKSCGMIPKTSQTAENVRHRQSMKRFDSIVASKY